MNTRKRIWMPILKKLDSIPDPVVVAKMKAKVQDKLIR